MAGDICAGGTARPQMKHSVGALQLGNLLLILNISLTFVRHDLELSGFILLHF